MDLQATHRLNDDPKSEPHASHSISQALSHSLGTVLGIRALLDRVLENHGLGNEVQTVDI